jgi:ribosomal protein S19
VFDKGPTEAATLSNYIKFTSRSNVIMPDMNVKRICIYHAGDFERFEAHEKDNLIKSHHQRIKVLPKIVGEDKPTTSVLS